MARPPTTPALDLRGISLGSPPAVIAMQIKADLPRVTNLPPRRAIDRFFRYWVCARIVQPGQYIHHVRLATRDGSSRLVVVRAHALCAGPREAGCPCDERYRAHSHANCDTCASRTSAEERGATP